MKKTNITKSLSILIIGAMLVGLFAPSLQNVVAIKPTGCLDKLGEEGVDYEINADFVGMKEHHPDCLVEGDRDYNCWNCRKEGCPTPVISISVDFDYESNIYFTDEPVVGMDYWLFDGSDVLFTSGTTDSTGAFSVIVRDGIDESNIYIVYYYQNENRTINNMIIGTNNFNLNGFGLNLDLIWSDTSNPAQVGTVELWYDGSLIDTFTLVGSLLDTLSVAGFDLPAGTYILKGAFYDEIISVDLLGSSTVSGTIELDAEGVIGACSPFFARFEYVKQSECRFYRAFKLILF